MRLDRYVFYRGKYGGRKEGLEAQAKRKGRHHKGMVSGASIVISVKRTRASSLEIGRGMGGKGRKQDLARFDLEPV